MKKVSILFIVAFCSIWGQILLAQKRPDWEDPQVIGINKENYHATLLLPSKKEQSKQIISLNGKWKFNWVNEPSKRPTDFYKNDYSVQNWADIVVPGNWQMQGYDKAIYTNWTYPFKKDAPYIMEEPPKNYYSYENRNPVGSYVTFFDVNPSMKGQRLFLHFEGVESAMYIWVNGQKVGYSENSMSPAEFEVTDYVQDGRNKLAVEVYRWSDGSYLEDQDMWRLSGIFRPVELWVRPQHHVQDYKIWASLDNHMETAYIKAYANIRNQGRKSLKNLTVEIDLKGKDSFGKAVQQTLISKAKGNLGIEKVNLTTVLQNPVLWSAEKPYLYDVTVRLKQKNTIVEEFQYHLGIRKVEVVGDLFTVNGKAVKLKGVNRHEHHPRTGRFVDTATLIKDLRLMKQANINMIRTSHYPQSPLLYELCDKYGFYVMDEANNESHDYGIGNKHLGDNPEWTKAHVDRALSLYHRDKNHPSVIFWSLGNEAGGGRNAVAMADTLRKLDDTRLIYYDSDRSVSDIYDEGYLHPDKFKALGEKITDRPVFMREYAHAMGNSLGNLQEYWDVIEADPSIVGAAIWEWAEHGIATKKDGSSLRYGANPSELALQSDEFFAYGGDFNDQPNYGAFCIDGIIRADRVPNPHFYEVQKVYQYIDFSFSFKNPTQIALHNKYFFTALGEFEFTYEYLVDGQVKMSGLASLADMNIMIMQYPIINNNEEVILNVYAKLKEATEWAEKGFVVAREQFVLQQGITGSIVISQTAVQLQEKNQVIEVKAGNTIVQIDAKNGALIRWSHKGEELLQAPLEPYFWKTANDNQKRAGYEREFGSWRHAAQNRIVKDVRYSVKEQIADIAIDMVLPDIEATYQLQYHINGDGQIQVDANYTPTAEMIANMPKFGMRMRVPRAYDQIEWYGRGEVENYPDRKTNAFLGLYTKQLNDFITHYTVPQDNANRTDVRWFSLGNTAEKIKITGLQALNFRAWPYDEGDLEKAKHPQDLPARDFINVNIDLHIHGVGGDDSWGAKTMEKYTNSGSEPYRYGFILSVE